MELRTVQKGRKAKKILKLALPDAASVTCIRPHLCRMDCHEQATTRRMDPYVTDEQRSSRPIFNATLRTAASWLFFRVARSTRMTQIWALLPPVRLGPRLEKQPTDLRRNPRDLGDGTLVLHSLNDEPSARLAFDANEKRSGHEWAAFVRTKPRYVDFSPDGKSLATGGSRTDGIPALYSRRRK
jgi:hypothetical protein